MTPPADPGATIPSEHSAFREVVRHRVVPVVVIDDAARAPGLARALLDGGLPVAEVTLRTPAALAAIRTMSGFDGLLVGAGTVLTSAQVDAVADSGARFVVSPGLDPVVVARCRELGLLPLPGAVTASEIMAALRLGLGAVKFFPAGTAGGAAAVDALAAPFAGIEFVPTGGIDESSAREYLALPCVPAVGGSWMAPRALVRDGEFAMIRDRCTRAVTAARAA